MLPPRIRQYLIGRGQNPDIFGWEFYYGFWWITIPVRDKTGKVLFYKLRKDPDDNKNQVKYKFYPPKSMVTIYYNSFAINNGASTSAIICEGEFDCELLGNLGYPAITSTSGAGTFKDEWLEELKNYRDIYLCFDNDDAGHMAVKMLTYRLLSLGFLLKHNLYIMSIPKGKDVTEFVINNNGNIKEVFDNAYKVNHFESAINISYDDSSINNIRASLYKLELQIEDIKKNFNINTSVSTSINIKDYILNEKQRIKTKLQNRLRFLSSNTNYNHDLSQIKQIPILSVLDSLNIDYYPAGNQVYKFKLREERTPSACAYTNDNHFYDYGSNIGGSVIDLVMNYKKCDIKTAIKYLSTGSSS